ncbi:MAG: hypothetical protein DRP08_03590, partial [Candidatus Aenigmatarchaeota archaeon]
TEQGEEEESFLTFLSRMQRPRPPKNVDVCNSWDPSTQLPGGIVTCTSYYDRGKSASCYENPQQRECFTQNCGSWVDENCIRLGRSLAHEKEYLDSVELKVSAPNRIKTKVDLVTQQWSCPGGSFTNYANCTDEQTVAMYPYECKEDNPDTPLDDNIMKYCDEDKPIRDGGSGAITGFRGTCPAEASENGQPFDMVCKVDYIMQNKKTCLEYGENRKLLKNEMIEESYDLNYVEQRVKVLSGALDRFATREDCVRANTIIDAREDNIYANITGSGALDDDIYVTVHSSDDTHDVVYCNQQHNENAGSKLNRPEFGGIIQCIDNDGTYSFSQKVTIKTADVVSIQQATEKENEGATPFQYRSHFNSSKFVIDGTESTPEARPSNFPYYPTRNEGNNLNLWENILGSLTILFPYSGSYTIYFFTDDGRLMAKKEIGAETFSQLGTIEYQQLFLAKDIPIAPTLDATNEDTLCLGDSWVEYGGGVHGGKGSVSGTPCQSPSSGNTFQKNNAIKRVVVNDKLTGSYTVIPLVYPLGYPNRVFVSKLNIHEDRIYHCYENPTIKAPF